MGVKVLLLGCISISLLAQEVYRDEYLIKPNVHAVMINKAGANIIESFSSGVVLLKPKTAKIISNKESKIVKFNENDNYCNYLIKNGIAKKCSPNFLVKALDLPNDQRLQDQWALKNVEAEQAWDVASGSDIVVPVLDTGVDYNHPDLIENMWVNPYEVKDGIDNDKNGYIDDIHGINAVDNSGDPMDIRNPATLNRGHGTHCAGIIAGTSNNGIGISGINRKAKIMALRFFDEDGYAATSDILELFDYIIDMKKRNINIKVTSNSWGSSLPSDIIDDGIAELNRLGILFVAAAGNDAANNDESPTYPANSDIQNVISVAAINSNLNLSWFSNYGARTVDIAAPGEDILSTFRGGYSYESGTSMATPYVAGAISLLAGLHPELTPEELIKRLYETATPLPTLTGLIKTGRSLNLKRLLNNTRIGFDDENLKVYNVNEISYNPDYSADSAESVINSDEAAFETISLPFNFPIGTGYTNQITLSPNGVIYLKQAPELWDNKNYSLAPVFSIAAFHTDLDPILGGVSYKKSNNKITIFWKAKHFRYASSGFVEVRTTLYSNGTIRSFVKVPVEQIIGLGTIGVTLADSTQAHSIKATHNSFGVEFVPVNVKETDLPNQVSITNINLSIKTASKKRVKTEKLFLNITGQGTGEIVLGISFDNYSCGNYATGFNNSLSLSTNVTSNMKKFSKLKITVQDKLSIVKTNSKKTKFKSIYLNRACSELVNNLR